MRKTLIPISLALFLAGCHKDCGFSPDYESPSIPAAQITDFSFQQITLQFTDQTWVFWSGDTLQLQSNNGQNTVTMWFIIDSLKDTTYTLDPYHASVTLYDNQGNWVSHSYGMTTATFYNEGKMSIGGSIQTPMQSFAAAGNGSVSFSNLGIPANE